VREQRFLVGTSGWSYPEWSGRFYPEGWPKSRWFDYYVTQFTTVEVNATFYRSFRDETYHKWRERAPEGFSYVLKVPRLITHRKRLADVGDIIRTFWRSARLLGDRLGLVLLQLPPKMPFDLARLEAALTAFPDPSRVAVEFRDERWLEKDAFTLLSRVGAVLVSADSPKTRMSGHVTSEVGYIRLHGRDAWYTYDYSEGELREIASVARSMAARGAETIYVFFNNDFGGHAPRNARALKEMLAA